MNRRIRKAMGRYKAAKSMDCLDCARVRLRYLTVNQQNRLWDWRVSKT